MSPQSSRILHVDDSPIFCDLIRLLLGDMGSRLDSVQSGEAALELLRDASSSYACLIVDHSMPRMNGLQFVQAARDQGYGGGIVVVSSFVQESARSGYARLGVHRILEKATNLGALLPQTVAMLLGGAEGAVPSIPTVKTETRRTFAELYCERHDLSSAKFASHVLKRSLHVPARFLYPLINLVAPDYFEADLDLVKSTGELRNYRDYKVEVSRFVYHPANSSLGRRLLVLRISTERLRRLLWSTLHPELEHCK